MGMKFSSEVEICCGHSLRSSAVVIVAVVPLSQRLHGEAMENSNKAVSKTVGEATTVKFQYAHDSSQMVEYLIGFVIN